MMGRVIVGTVCLLIGLGIMGTALVDALAGDGGPGSAQAAATPAATSAPVPSATPAPSQNPSPSASRQAPTPAATAAPTPAPTPDPVAQVTAFYAILVPAVRGPDADRLRALLHPATIERYGEDACRAYLGGLDDPSFDVAVVEVRPPAEWEYVTDDRPTLIPDAWTVEADLTTQGDTQARELHIAAVDGELRWFTDCGEPIE